MTTLDTVRYGDAMKAATYPRTDRITPIRYPAPMKRRRLTAVQRLLVLAMGTGAAGLGIAIGTAIATVFGLR